MDALDVELYSVNDNAVNMKSAIHTSQHLTKYNCDILTIKLRIMDKFNNGDGMQTGLDKYKRLAAFTHRTTTELEKLKD